MTVEIYAVRIDRHVDVIRLAQFVSPERRERMRRQVNRDDAVRTLVGELLVRWLACQKLHLDNSAILIETGEFGKPFLAGVADFHFSLSHSGAWVVAAYDEHAVGVDIEEVRAVDLQLARSFFSPLELESLYQAGSNQNRYFHKIWTLKESYLKAVGTGLGDGMDSLGFLVDDDGTVRPLFPSPMFFRQYDIDRRYELALCAASSCFPDEVAFPDVERLVNAPGMRRLE